ncbi:MAG: Ig-like domain-containing protein [Clostridiales bacterium]|nr:Ig-like domain-containing protein [Clostridiales bacterium]
MKSKTGKLAAAVVACVIALTAANSLIPTLSRWSAMAEEAAVETEFAEQTELSEEVVIPEGPGLFGVAAEGPDADTLGLPALPLVPPGADYEEAEKSDDGKPALEAAWPAPAGGAYTIVLPGTYDVTELSSNTAPTKVNINVSGVTLTGTFDNASNRTYINFFVGSARTFTIQNLKVTNYFNPSDWNADGAKNLFTFLGGTNQLHFVGRNEFKIVGSKTGVTSPNAVAFLLTNSAGLYAYGDSWTEPSPTVVSADNYRLVFGADQSVGGNLYVSKMEIEIPSNSQTYVTAIGAMDNNRLDPPTLIGKVTALNVFIDAKTDLWAAVGGSANVMNGISANNLVVNANSLTIGVGISCNNESKSDPDAPKAVLQGDVRATNINIQTQQWAYFPVGAAYNSRLTGGVFVSGVFTVEANMRPGGPNDILVGVGLGPRSNAGGNVEVNADQVYISAYNIDVGIGVLQADETFPGNVIVTCRDFEISAAGMMSGAGVGVSFSKDTTGSVIFRGSGKITAARQINVGLGVSKGTSAGHLREIRLEGALGITGSPVFVGVGAGHSGKTDKITVTGSLGVESRAVVATPPSYDPDFYKGAVRVGVGGYNELTVSEGAGQIAYGPAFVGEIEITGAVSVRADTNIRAGIGVCAANLGGSSGSGNIYLNPTAYNVESRAIAAAAGESDGYMAGNIVISRGNFQQRLDGEDTQPAMSRRPVNMYGEPLGFYAPNVPVWERIYRPGTTGDPSYVYVANRSEAAGYTNLVQIYLPERRFGFEPVRPEHRETSVPLTQIITLKWLAGGDVAETGNGSVYGLYRYEDDTLVPIESAIAYNGEQATIRPVSSLTENTTYYVVAGDRIVSDAAIGYRTSYPIVRLEYVFTTGDTLPTDVPTNPPTEEPTEDPTEDPTDDPTDPPTDPPTDDPTFPPATPTPPTPTPTPWPTSTSTPWPTSSGGYYPTVSSTPWPSFNPPSYPVSSPIIPSWQPESQPPQASWDITPPTIPGDNTSPWPDYSQPPQSGSVGGVTTSSTPVRPVVSPGGAGGGKDNPKTGSLLDASNFGILVAFALAAFGFFLIRDLREEAREAGEIRD